MAVERPQMKLRILLAEDDGIQACGLEEELREAGHDVVAVTSSLPETIQFLAEHPVDAIVVDLELRGRMTFPVLDVAARKGIPQIVITGYDTDALKEFRGVRVLSKPFALGDLLQVLAELRRYPPEGA
jgi:CheY-like chemotaxis protein